MKKKIDPEKDLRQFQAGLEMAKKIVSDWPDWKRNLLGKLPTRDEDKSNSGDDSTD